MKLLALRLCEHDSNFSYYDGNDLHYFKSERAVQIKHHGFSNLWEWKKVIKDIWNLDSSDLDEIAIVFDPWIHNLPLDNESFFPAIEYEYFPANCKVWRVSHHLAHSLSTWIVTDKDPDISFIFDGYGDRDRAWTVIKNQKIIDTGSLDINGSLGTEIAHAGRYLGITASVDLDLAGKVMGFQSYGSVDNDYLKYLESFDIYSTKEIFSVENWEKYVGDKLLANHNLLTWISTVHERVGDVLLDYFKKYANKTDTISYTGGVAQNVIWNTKLKNYFPNLIIPPHCADDGLSLGAIEWLRIKNNLPKFKIDNFPFCQKDIPPDSNLSKNTIDIAAELLSKGKTVAWYQEHGEIGPRALGNRSIFLDPRIVNGKEIINSIKNREMYRPFGAVVLEEHKNIFELEYNNPFMLYVGKSNVTEFPSITHIDNTCRVQTIKNENTNLRKLLEKFYELTGCPVLLNTSLNLAGKPIAGNPKDAVKLFYNSTLDVLVLGDEIFIK